MSPMVRGAFSRKLLAELPDLAADGVPSGKEEAP